MIAAWSASFDAKPILPLAGGGNYVRNWSVWLDLVVLARTVRVVLLGKGAY